MIEPTGFVNRLGIHSIMLYVMSIFPAFSSTLHKHIILLSQSDLYFGKENWERVLDESIITRSKETNKEEEIKSVAIIIMIDHGDLNQENGDGSGGKSIHLGQELMTGLQ